MEHLVICWQYHKETDLMQLSIVNVELRHDVKPQE